MTPCFRWTPIIEKKFLENFVEMTIFVKNNILRGYIVIMLKNQLFNKKKKTGHQEGCQ